MKKNLTVRYFLLSTLLLGICCISCNKETSESPYYISFKADSISFVFKQNLQFSEINLTPIYECVISGEGTNGRNIRLSVLDTMPVSARSYAWGADDDTTFIPVDAFYETQGKLYSSISHDSTYIILNLTSINDSTTQGTFFGRLDLPGKGSVTITNGAFFVKRTE